MLSWHEGRGDGQARVGWWCSTSPLFWSAYTGHGCDMWDGEGGEVPAAALSLLVSPIGSVYIPAGGNLATVPLGGKIGIGWGRKRLKVMQDGRWRRRYLHGAA